MKSFGTTLIECNFSFKKWCKPFDVRDFYLIKSGDLMRVNFIFNNFYFLEGFYSLEGFKNRPIVLRDIAEIKSFFDFAIVYRKHALVWIEIYSACEGLI